MKSIQLLFLSHVTWVEMTKNYFSKKTRVQKDIFSIKKIEIKF